MQKDIIQNDPLAGDDENRAVGVSVKVTIPLRNAEGGEEE